MAALRGGSSAGDGRRTAPKDRPESVARGQDDAARGPDPADQGTNDADQGPDEAARGPDPAARAPDAAEQGTGDAGMTFAVEPPPPGALRVTVEGIEPFVSDVVPDPALRPSAMRAVRRLPERRDGIPADPARYEVTVDGWRFEATVEPSSRAFLRDRVRRTADRPGGGRHVVRAQIPGRILHVWAAAGQTIEAGARLCSLEAMKMENEVRASRAGTIERVSVEPGTRVEVGDELVVIV